MFCFGGAFTPVNAYSDLQYEGGEPCTVCGHTLARHDGSANKSSAFPTEILPGFLYLGSYDNASRSELLKTVGITHILNVRLYGDACDGVATSLASQLNFWSVDCTSLPELVQKLLSLPHSVL